MDDEVLDQDQDEFDAAFDASIKPADEAAKDKPEPAPAPPQPKPAAAEADEDEGEGEGEPQATQPPAPAPAPAADPVADLQRQLDEARHRERSSANRVSHFMRESNQLTQRVQALEAENARLKQATPASAPSPAASAADLEGVLAEAPDLRDAVRKLIAAEVTPFKQALEAANTRLTEAGQEVQKVRQEVEPLVHHSQEQQVLQVQQALDKSFPGWGDEIKSEPFQTWLPTQPEAIRSMFLNGKSFDEAATVLRLYRADKGAPETKAPPEGEPPGKPEQDAANERLRKAAGLAPRTPARVSTKKDDFEGSFDEFAAQIKR